MHGAVEMPRAHCSTQSINRLVRGAKTDGATNGAGYAPVVLSAGNGVTFTSASKHEAPAKHHGFYVEILCHFNLVSPD